MPWWTVWNTCNACWWLIAFSTGKLPTCLSQSWFSVINIKWTLHWPHLPRIYLWNSVVACMMQRTSKASNPLQIMLKLSLPKLSMWQQNWLLQLDPGQIIWPGPWGWTFLSRYDTTVQSSNHAAICLMCSDHSFSILQYYRFDYCMPWGKVEMTNFMKYPLYKQFHETPIMSLEEEIPWITWNL